MPTYSQILALRALYKGYYVQIRRDINVFSSVRDIINRYKNGKYDDLVIVGPLSMISKITEFGVHPLWAKMQQVEREYSETSNNGRHYVFVEFKRIKELHFTFEEELLPA